MRRSHVMRGACQVVAAALWALSLATAQAQDHAETERPAPAPSAPADQIVEVTGSRIAQVASRSVSPMIVVTQAELAATAATTLDEALTRLPSVTLQGLGKNNNAGGDGLSLIELRNMGPARTLVLLNGRRLVPASAGAVSAIDLSTIPLQLVERIEILLDGASAIYGADAVAGVVNVILDDDFDGLRVDANAGISGAGDAEELGGSVTLGQNHARGNLTVSVHGLVRRPVWQRDRAWSRRPIVDRRFVDGMGAAGGIATTYGSSVVPEGGDGSVFFRPDPSTGQTFTRLSSRDLDQRYDLGARQWLVAGQERLGASLHGDYDLTDTLRVFVEALHTFRHSRTQLAPQTFAVPGTTAFPSGLTVPLDNPFIPADYRATLAEGTTAIALRRRNVEVGDRIADVDAHTARVVLGLAGELPAATLDWEAYANVGIARTTRTTRNSIDLARAHETAAPARCALNADRGCVVGNYFGAGTLAPEVVDYIRYTDVESAGTSHVSVGGTVSAQPIPWEGERIGIASGVLFRREAAFTRPSPVIAAGDGSANARDEVSGSTRALEAFVELRVPVLAHRPGAALVALDGAGRYTHTRPFGAELTYRGGLTYAPIEDLSLRGGYATAFRAPSVTELYGGTIDSFDAGTDPCSGYDASVDPALAARCVAAGVPAGYQATPGQVVRTNIGGNPRLHAETARVLSVGAVFAPQFLPASFGTLRLSANYYRLQIDDVIESPSLQTVVDACYLGARSPAECAAVRRSPEGILASVDLQKRNLYAARSSGIDFGARYGAAIAAWGVPAPLRLDLALQGHRLLVQDDLYRTEKVRYAGTASARTLYPKWRLHLALALSGPSWSVLSTHRFLSSTRLFDRTRPDGRVPSVVYWDLTGTYTVGRLTLMAGIANLLDRDPPRIVDAAVPTNSNPHAYDFVGRFFFSRLRYQL